MQYWMMRLFLSDRWAGTIFALTGKKPEVSREQYLKKVFSSEIRFVHRTQTYVFTPFPPASDKILCGVIAREHTVTIAKPPEENYQRLDVSDWDTANVFIDISGESDGQKVAVQDMPSIGRPLPVFRSLADHINNKTVESDWFVAVNTITSPQDFWDVVQEYQGRITELDLVFVAPNIWNGHSETETALKSLDKQYGVKETEIKLKNPDGRLNPGTQDGKGAVLTALSYIRRGGGRWRMKSGKRTVYNSEDHVIKRSPPQDSSVQDIESSVVSALAEWLMSRQ